MIKFKNSIVYLCMVAMFGFYSTSLSARYLMDPAKAIKEDVENIAQLPESAGKITKTVKNDVGDLTDSAVKGLTGDEGVNAQGGIVDDYNNKKNLRIAASKFVEVDAENADILKNPDKYTPAQKDAALNTFNKYAADEFGVKNTNGVSGYNGMDSAGKPEDKAIANGKEVNKSNLNGLYDIDNKTIGINEAKQDGSTEKLTKTDGHEFNHYLQDTNGRAANLTQTQKEAGSERLGDQLYNALSDEIGPGVSANPDHQDWVNNQDFSNGNAQAAAAKNIEALPANESIENAKLTSAFSPKRVHPKTGKITKHSGVDLISYDADQTIVSVADGTVIQKNYDYNSESNTGWGNYIVIDNGNGYQTRYAHLKELPTLNKGDQVNEGDTIGNIGETGGVTGPHLHFELIKEGKPVNPQNSNGSYKNIGKYNTREEAKKANSN